MNKQIISIEKKILNQNTIIKLLTIMLVLHTLYHDCFMWQIVIGYLSLSYESNIFFSTTNMSRTTVVAKYVSVQY